MGLIFRVLTWEQGDRSCATLRQTVSEMGLMRYVIANQFFLTFTQFLEFFCSPLKGFCPEYSPFEMDEVMFLKSPKCCHLLSPSRITYWAASGNISNDLGTLIPGAIRDSFLSDAEEGGDLGPFFKGLVKNQIVKMGVNPGSSLNWFSFKRARHDNIYFMVLKLDGVIYAYCQIETKDMGSLGRKLSLVHIASGQIVNSLRNRNNTGGSGTSLNEPLHFELSKLELPGPLQKRVEMMLEWKLWAESTTARVTMQSITGGESL